MPSELHLRPERLRDHARSASGLADELFAALRGAPVGFDAERLQGAVRAAVSELAELAAALHGAAAAGSAADAEVSATITRLRDVLERP
ncbi:hypothetical protein [Pseudonocardia adelaidensis]|uniref:HPt domain-containing protein n=1 Tax=Pseudonocardia adelaidensis TaxID=648754 RepID=A0ABP9P545_9PSEU